MPKYYEEIVDYKDHRPCDGVREDLKICLLESDCVRVHKKTPKECLNCNDDTVPEECRQLRMAFFECKRSLLDNRQRFRGRKGY